MSADRRPDPNCPYCHGSGVIILVAPFLDRIDESTTACRCVSQEAVDPSEEDTLVVKKRD
jgi:hypothetical protein